MIGKYGALPEKLHKGKINECRLNSRFLTYHTIVIKQCLGSGSASKLNGS